MTCKAPAWHSDNAVFTVSFLENYKVAPDLPAP